MSIDIVARWRVTGTMEDTVLVQPITMSAVGGMLLLSDWATKRVVALDRDNGALRWTVGGPGRGPGEFLGPVVFAGVNDSAIIAWDRTQRRITFITTRGTVAGSIAVNVMRVVQGMCALDTQRAVATLSSGAHAALNMIDLKSGQSVPGAALPWIDLAELPSLAAQLSIQQINGSCVVAPVYSSRVGILDRNGAFCDTFALVEPVPLPSMRESKVSQGTRQSLSGATVSAVLGAASIGGRLVIAFGGQSALRRRLLDFYEWKDGKYVGSLVTAGPITALASDDRRLYVLTESNDGFFVIQAMEIASTEGRKE